MPETLLVTGKVSIPELKNAPRVVIIFLSPDKLT